MTSTTMRRMTEQFGEPHTNTGRVLRWNMRPGLDVVVQSAGSERSAVDWVPWPNGEAPPVNGKVYRPHQGRTGHSYARAPSLAKDKPVLKLRVNTQDELEDVMKRIA